MKEQRFDKSASPLSVVDLIEDDSGKAFSNKSASIIKEEEVIGFHIDLEDNIFQAEWGKSTSEAIKWGVPNSPGLFMDLLRFSPPFGLSMFVAILAQIELSRNLF